MSLLPLGLLSQGGGASGPTDYEFITSTVLGTSQASVEFSSLPAGYRHFELRLVIRSTQATTQDLLRFRLNGDGSSNYSYVSQSGNGGSASAASSITETYTYPGYFPGSTATANAFGSSKILVTDVTSTSKYLTGNAMTGFMATGSNSLQTWHGFTRKVNAAMTSITFTAGGSFAAGSRFSLYGYKG